MFSSPVFFDLKFAFATIFKFLTSSVRNNLNKPSKNLGIDSDGLTKRGPVQETYGGATI